MWYTIVLAKKSALQFCHQIKVVLCSVLHVKGESVGFSSQGAVYAISRLGRRKFLLFTTIQAAAVQESRTLRAMLAQATAWQLAAAAQAADTAWRQRVYRIVAIAMNSSARH